MTLIALTVGLLGLAQTQGTASDPNYLVFQGALDQLSSQPTLFLQLNGSITYRGKSTPLVSNLSWNSTVVGTALTLQVDLESYSNGVLIRRIVGDGSTLWSYDLALHQYSATSYGGTPGLARPETYATDLLNHVNWAATGPDGYVAKLLRQIYNSANSTYTSWMPGFLSVQLQQDLPVIDSVNSQLTYMSTPTDNFYMYDGSPKRTIVWEIAAGLSTNLSSQPVSGLQNIYFNQAEIVAKNTRLTQWQITPYTGLTFSSDVFQPYTGKQIQGWRPVVAPKPVSN